MKSFYLLAGLGLFMTGCGRAGHEPIRVSAAASTREAMDNLADVFQNRTGIPVQINFGASSTLARQIEEGGPADIFLSADEGWANYLEKAGLVDRRRDLLGNRLVVIGRRDRPLTLSGLQDLAGEKIERLALAGPSVPAGKYARMALEKAGIAERLRNRIVSGKDVRATLAFVEQGEVEAGIVYATDAAVSTRLKVVLEIPESLHAPIRYPVVFLRRHPIRDEVKLFYDFLASANASRVFRKAGFTVFGKEEIEEGTPDWHDGSASFLGLRGEDWHAVILSLKSAGLAVLLSLPAGLALAWLLARKNFPGKALVETAVNLPLVLPPVVTGYMLLLLLGKNGWIGSRLHDWFGVRIALTWWGVVLAVGIMGFPLLVRAVRLAFQEMDPRLFQAARSLGAGPLDTFWTVSLPLARNGIIAGVVLAFARALGEFGATLMFAGDMAETRTLAIQIYNLHSFPDEPSEKRMWTLVAVSVVIAGAALVVSEYLERRGRRRPSA